MNVFTMRVVNCGEKCGELWHTYYTDMIYGMVIFLISFSKSKLLVQISPVLFVNPPFSASRRFFLLRSFCSFPEVIFLFFRTKKSHENPVRLGIKNGDLLTVNVKARVPEAWLQWWGEIHSPEKWPKCWRANWGEITPTYRGYSKGWVILCFNPSRPVTPHTYNT